MDVTTLLPQLSVPWVMWEMKEMQTHSDPG